MDQDDCGPSLVRPSLSWLVLVQTGRRMVLGGAAPSPAAMSRSAVITVQDGYKRLHCSESTNGLAADDRKSLSCKSPQMDLPRNDLRI